MIKYNKSSLDAEIYCDFCPSYKLYEKITWDSFLRRLENLGWIAENNKDKCPNCNKS